jgi:hypothetical protein
MLISQTHKKKPGETHERLLFPARVGRSIAPFGFAIAAAHADARMELETDLSG